MSDDLIARLRSPEEVVFPAGTKITLDNGKTMELLEPFSMWSSSSDKHDAAAEITSLRAENNHLRRVNMDRPSAELHEAALAELRAEIERLRAENSKLKSTDMSVAMLEMSLRDEITRLREQLHLANIDAVGAHAEANDLRVALADAVALIERLIDTRRCGVSDLRTLNAARAALEVKP